MARSFDADGRMTANELAQYSYDAAGRVTGITQKLWASRTVTTVSGTTTMTTTELFQKPISWTAGYDSRNRLTSFSREGAATQYTYDPNSNRLTAAETSGGEVDLEGNFDQPNQAQSLAQALKIEPTSNRLLGFTQTLTKTQSGETVASASSAVNYTFDANGSMTSDGLRTFEYDANHRLAKVLLSKDGEAAAIDYLHNAIGQRVFKSEPQVEQTLPKEEDLGPGFINWLKKNFGWMFLKGKKAKGQLGESFVYGDGEIPEWALLGSYDNGTATGKGTNEFIWLPTEDGMAIPVGLYRAGKFYAIHTDNLGTPRLITDSTNRPVWQWPYTAFGNNKPTGVLATATINGVTTTKASKPIADLNLRFPGQFADEETGTFYNFLRDSLDPAVGRYRQFDPLGLRGGPNRFIYVDGNPLSMIDPEGLMGQGSGAGGRRPTWGKGGPNTTARPSTFAAFGCIGLMCATSGSDGPQFSAELSFGGGIEICDAPPPPPAEPESCGRNDGSGFYSGAGKTQVQPPGLPVPKRLGGAFFGPAWKANGQFCLRVGPHGSVPFVPSIDLPSPRS